MARTVSEAGWQAMHNQHWISTVPSGPYTCKLSACAFTSSGIGAWQSAQWPGRKVNRDRSCGGHEVGLARVSLGTEAVSGPASAWPLGLPVNRCFVTDAVLRDIARDDRSHARFATDALHESRRGSV